MTGFAKRLFGGDNETRDVIVVLAAALLLWEGCVRLFHPSPLILPAPSAILAAFLETPGLFMRHLGFTLGMTCIGFVLAVVLGVALAVGIVYSRLLERTIYTLLVALNSIPVVPHTAMVRLAPDPPPAGSITGTPSIDRAASRASASVSPKAAWSRSFGSSVWRSGSVMTTQITGRGTDSRGTRTLTGPTMIP